MSVTSSSKGKGKEQDIIDASNSDATDSVSSLSSDSESDSDDNEPITQEYLNSLLEKARRNAALAASSDSAATSGEKEEILILEDESTLSIPTLNPGQLPPSYFSLNSDQAEGSSSSLLRDPDAERARKASSLLATPAPPTPPPEITKSGRPLTKRQKKELKNKTAGPDWFDLPAPSEADLPRLYREVEALRLRNQLDPKRFYRKEEGEGKGIKGLPKHFAIGTVVATKNPFGAATAENLTRAERKRTLVDELIDDAEAKRYAKKKFEELQSDRGAKGRNTLAAKKAARMRKW